MAYEFDPVKNKLNLEKHGLTLSDVEGFDWEVAVINEDKRATYAEARFEAISLIEDRLHVLVFCIRGEAVRVISLRKANAREVKRYAA